MELTHVVQCAVEVTFKEGGRSGWVGRIDLARSLARHATTVIVIFFFEVVYHHILGVDELVDVGHEVGDGVGVCFMDLLEELEVSYPLLVVGYDIFILDAHKSVVVLEIAVSVLMESFILPHPHFGEVVSVVRAVVGRLIVGCE
jgi:hypothetical protein